jgi:2-dehydropantoate 2-reductase
MRIAILGAGGVGGYYGALLAQSGHDVTFVARGDHLQAIQHHGLRVDSVHGAMLIQPARATDDPTAIGEVDLVLVAVKAYDLDTAAKKAHPLVGRETVVLPLLNRLDAADRLAEALGRSHVLVGLTHTSSSIASPGVIHQVSPIRRITLGEMDGRITPRAKCVADVLAQAGVDAVLSPSIQIPLWEKFVFIAAISGVCCLARRPMGPVLSAPETRQLYIDALSEVEAVGRAQGISLPGDLVENTLALSEGFSPQTKPSLLAALEAGQRLELEALNGTVVRLGQRLGIATPVHRVIYAALKPSAYGQENPP